mmetsp:Transcript_16427/g.50019  ORF Transcript_16427/g.50019 Transcript_16427/m.50019 type:complete len:334 (+) Transcript_16427:283-1284(+)
MTSAQRSQVAAPAVGAARSGPMPALIHVNSFTSDPFGGNPAAVCLMIDEPDDGWMHGVAANMNLSETAFVRPIGGAQFEGAEGEAAKGETFELRWFTPTVEVNLCGHATLAAAHVLFSRPGGRASDVLRFSSLSGELRARRMGDGQIELDFPAKTAQSLRTPLATTDVAAALQLHADLVQVIGAAMDLLVRLPDAAAVRSLSPDFKAIARLPFRGVIVTAMADAGSKYDFVSRFFGPAAGINEDPVTGSAHCTLAPYWANQLGGKRLLRAKQLSARGGDLEVELSGVRKGSSGANEPGGTNPGDERIFIRGHAVSTLEGRVVSPLPPPAAGGK